MIFTSLNHPTEDSILDTSITIITNSMQQKLEYINEGRGGYVVYKDNENELKLFFEYGGGNCVAIIYVPTIKEWVNRTRINIEERERVLRFIAEQSIKDQAPNCNYEAYDDCIKIYSLVK
jgi:hypothetical protein